MFEVSVRGDGKVPHRDSIARIWGAHPLLKAITHLDPIVAGGFAAALMYGPRVNKTTLDTSYYGDIDIWARNKAHYEQLINGIYQACNLVSITTKAVTDNAITFSVEGTQIQPITVQVVERLQGEPLDILGKFDILNAAIAYVPKTGEIFYSKKGLAAHLAGELEMVSPTLLTVENQYLVESLLRIYKYCERWNYALSDDTWRQLTELRKTYPVLWVTEKQMRASFYGDEELWADFPEGDVWELLGELINSHHLSLADASTPSQQNGIRMGPTPIYELGKPFPVAWANGAPILTEKELEQALKLEQQTVKEIEDFNPKRRY